MKIHINKLDVIVSLFVRKRDGVCQACGRAIGKLEAAHCFGRWQKSVRYDEENICTLCFQCHQWYDHHDTEKKEFFRNRLGQERFDMLEHRMRNMDKIDTELLTMYYKEKLK